MTISHSATHRAHGDRTAGFVELFFDLVFVFCVTQVVHLVHGHLTWAHAGQAVLVFWLVWWAWTQFTWALNAANANHTLVELGMLVATGASFFMAVALPGAYEDTALGFAVAYVAVRALGLALYAWIAWSDHGQRTAVCTFTSASVLGLVAVVAGGVAGGAWQYTLWGLAIALDVVAALVGGRADGWDLRPEHFVERHGLFVIIALGESLIVAANGVAQGGWHGPVLLDASLAVTLTCALWWTYFVRAKPALAHAMEHRQSRARAEFARDAFSLFHFPMMLGVIALAVGVEQVLSHPEEALPTDTAVALAAGLILFLGGTGLALRRARGTWPWPRLALTAAGGGLVLAAAGREAHWALAALLASAAAVALVEQRRHT